MNIYDKLVANYVLTKFRAYKNIPWGALNGTAHIPDLRVMEDLFRHLQVCPDTKAIITDGYDGPISDVTPDPHSHLFADITCKHAVIKDFVYHEYSGISEIIEWIERNEENQSK